MLRKYLPFIGLLLAVILFIWVKYNQRKSSDKGGDTVYVNASDSGPFARDTGKLVYSRHARCRMECRHITEAEVKEVLAGGSINYSKVEEDKKGVTYPLEGVTHEGQHVRIVIAPHEKELVVVTVIDLEEEWQCNCN